jgi:hypothetical protein
MSRGDIALSGEQNSRATAFWETSNAKSSVEAPDSHWFEFVEHDIPGHSVSVHVVL